MPGRTVPMSVRITPDDAAFIAMLDIDGAITPSEKIRALIKEARRRAERKGDYLALVSELDALIAPAVAAIRTAERERDTHSEFLALFAEWLPDVVAELMSRTAAGPADLDLEALEAAVARRVFRLVERALRLSVAPDMTAYDGANLSKYLPKVLELARIIETQTKQSKKEKENG